LNKVDLVDAAALANAEARIKSINPYAKIVKTEKCGVALDQVLGLDAFSLERVLEIEPDFLDEDHTHEHEEDITSVSLSSDVALDEKKFQAWFGKLLRERGQDILRSKGILDFAGQDERFVVHAVHMLTDGSPLGPWPAGKPRGSKLVFIGRDLGQMGLAEGFAACKAA
jgi:G3E family GTPase